MGPSDSSARRSLTPRGSARRRKKSTTRMPRAAPLSGASANSSSPKRRAIRRILARRSKEWGRALEKRQIYQNCAAPPAGAESALAGGFQPLDALLEACRLITQRLDLAGEFLRIGGAHQQRLLFHPVFGEVFRKPQHGFALPCRKGLPARGEAVGDDVPEHRRQIFLDVPDQSAEERVDGAREVRRSFDFDPAARALVASEQQREGAGLELDHERTRRPASRAIEQAAFQDREAQVWERKAADLDALPGKGSQALRRQRLPRKQMVQAGDRAALEHGSRRAGRRRIIASAGFPRAASPRRRSPACTGSRSPRRARPRP